MTKRKRAAAPTFPGMERRVTRSQTKRNASNLADFHLLTQEDSVQTPAGPSTRDVDLRSAQNSTPNNFTSLTEMLSMIAAHVARNQVDELDEVQSDLRVSIQPGYSVREAYASTLRKIIEKHGDIAMNCTLKSEDNRSISLEKLCRIVHKLQTIKLREITVIQVKEMLDAVIDLKKSVKFDVEWLIKNLVEILEALELVNRLKVCQDRNLKVVQESMRAVKGSEDLIQVYEDKLKKLKEKV